MISWEALIYAVDTGLRVRTLKQYMNHSFSPRNTAFDYQSEINWLVWNIHQQLLTHPDFKIWFFSQILFYA